MNSRKYLLMLNGLILASFDTLKEAVKYKETYDKDNELIIVLA